jgi:hypothetical protein
MRRRHFVTSLPFLLGGSWAARASDAAPAGTLDEALRWLDALEPRAAAVRTTGAWPLATVLQHLAQSIEMSLDGYPEPRGALFQHTVGAAAFGYFKWKGRMSHGLAEPIPGAPALPAADAPAGAQRLRLAIARFQRHQGPLKPHFAYGALAKPDYAIAHALHIANHRDEIPWA